MLKTNSKKALENIRKSIAEEVELLLEEREIKTDSPCRAYLAIVEDEKRWAECRRLYNFSRFEMFKDWAQGLGGYALACDIYLRSAVDLLAEWLEETDEEKGNFTEGQAEDRAVYLFYRELCKMAEKEA